MKFKKLIALGLAAVMAVGLIGCGGGGADKTEAPAGEVEADGEVDKSQKLVIYSNSFSNDQDQWLLEAATAAGFNIECVPVGGSEMADRLIAEKNNPVCDVAFGMNAVEYERLKAENVLMKYTPEWVDKVDMAFGDAKDGMYYPIIVQPLFLIYNKDVVTNPPKAWEDLQNPEYKGLFNMFQLSGGTAKMITSSILQKYKDENGEYGVSEEGWKVIENIYANCHYQQDGEDYITAVIDGTVPMSELWGAGVVKFENEYNTEFGIMEVEEGAPFVVEQLAIINGSKNNALALEFINWFGAAEQMLGWSNNAGAIPANKDALAQVTDQKIVDMINNTKVQDVDWGFVAENVTDWVEKIQLEYLD
jgi:iron(III) transport system substrate-binding protein